MVPLKVLRLLGSSRAAFLYGRSTVNGESCRCLLTDASLGLDQFDDFCRQQAAILQHSDQSQLVGRVQEYLKCEQPQHLNLLSSGNNCEVEPPTTVTPSSQPVQSSVTCLETEHDSHFILGRDVRDAIVTVATNVQSAIEIDQIVTLFKDYCKQNDNFDGLSAFVAGPSVMRLLHRLNRCDDAFQLMTDRWSEHVDYLICYQLCMDLLFEHGQYDRVLQVWNKYQEEASARNDPNSVKYPKTLSLLVLASYYHQGTAASLRSAIQLLTKCSSARSPLPARSLVYVSALAANLNQPRVSMEILSMLGDQVNSTMVSRSQHLSLLGQLGLIQEGINLLSDLVLADLPVYRHSDRHIAHEAVDQLKDAIERLNKPELNDKFEALYSLLRDGAHLSALTIQDMLRLPVRTQMNHHEMMLESVPESAESMSEGMLPYDQTSPPRPLISTGSDVDNMQLLINDDQELNLDEDGRLQVSDPSSTGLNQAHKQAVFRRAIQRRKSHGPMPDKKPPKIDYTERVKL